MKVSTMYIKSIAVIINQNGKCLNIHCDDCYFQKNKCENFNRDQRVHIAKEELKKYTEEEIFEAML